MTPYENPAEHDGPEDDCDETLNDGLHNLQQPSGVMLDEHDLDVDAEDDAHDDRPGSP